MAAKRPDGTGKRLPLPFCHRTSLMWQRLRCSAGDVTGTMVKGLAQRVVGHSSTAAAGNPHATAVMAMAQQALRRERHRAAAAAPPAVKRGAHSTRAAGTARRPVSAAARLQAGLGGIATSPFVATGAFHPSSCTGYVLPSPLE